MTLTAELMADIARWTACIHERAEELDKARAARTTAFDCYGVPSMTYRKALVRHSLVLGAWRTAMAEREYHRERLARACEPWFWVA